MTRVANARKGLAARRRNNAPTIQTQGVRGHIDYGILACTLGLIVLGLMMVFSSSSYSQSSLGNDPLKEFTSQLIFGALGIGGMLITMNLNYNFFRKPIIVYGALGLSVVLLALIYVLPPEKFILTAPVINGSKRWIFFMGQSIQPSELAKFAVIFFVSAYLTARPKQIASLSQTILPCLGVCGLIFALVFKYNLSTAGTILIVTVAMLFIAGVPGKYFTFLIGGGVALAIPLTIFESYRMRRLMSFLDPWEMASSDGYQLVQSLYALGAGGWFGTGIGMSRQKQLFLPYASSDFIFAIVGEELGFIGAIAIIALFFLLIFFGIKTAIQCPDRYGRMLASGITALIATQVVINVAVVTGSMPTTGLPLPFFTAGGTSFFLFITAMGILMNISRYKSPTAIK